MDDDVAYLLLTPGPLTTSRSVKQAMLRDVSTWDHDYNDVVERVRAQLVELASGGSEYTAVLMQGSGTFAVESTLGSVVPPDGKLLVVSNGAYGNRLAEIAKRLAIKHVTLVVPETQAVDPQEVDRILSDDRAITHVAMVHCETTTGLLNPGGRGGTNRTAARAAASFSTR